MKIIEETTIIKSLKNGPVISANGNKRLININVFSKKIAKLLLYLVSKFKKCIIF